MEFITQLVFVFFYAVALYVVFSPKWELWKFWLRVFVEILFWYVAVAPFVFAHNQAMGIVSLFVWLGVRLFILNMIPTGKNELRWNLNLIWVTGKVLFIVIALPMIVTWVVEIVGHIHN